MQYRRLGGTELDVSVVCLGPMRAATKEPADDAKSRAGENALRHAIDSGVNFIHSSYEYRTRWMMERVLKDHPKRHDLHHVIKVPVPDFKDDGVFGAAKFRLRVEEALGELHADRIAILQWLWRSSPNEDALRLPMLPGLMDDLMVEFEKLRDAGKAGYLMPFPYTVDCARAALDTGKFDGLIGYYNPVEMEMAELFDDMAAKGLSFLPIRPLYQGILTDARSGQAELGEGDRFRDAKYKDDFAKRAAIAAAFEDEIGDSMTNFAVRFSLASPVVGSIIVGLNSPEQTNGIIAAVEKAPLNPDIVGRARTLWQAGFGL